MAKKAKKAKKPAKRARKKATKAKAGAGDDVKGYMRKLRIL